jgi:hypothetical protein
MATGVSGTNGGVLMFAAAAANRYVAQRPFECCVASNSASVCKLFGLSPRTMNAVTSDVSLR